MSVPNSSSTRLATLEAAAAGEGVVEGLLYAPKNAALLTALTGVDSATGDLLYVYDVSAAALKKMTRAEVMAMIEAVGSLDIDVLGNAATADSAAAATTATTASGLLPAAFTDPAAPAGGMADDDLFLVSDTSAAGAAKKVTKSELASALGGGASPVLESDWVTLTDAEVKTLSTVGKVIVAAPGAGKVLVYHSAYLVYDFSTAGYTNVHTGDADEAIVYFVSDSAGNFDQVSVVNVFPTTAEDAFAVLPAQVRQNSAGLNTNTPRYNASDWTNKPLEVRASNNGLGPFTGGNAANAMKVKVWYSEVTL